MNVTTVPFDAVTFGGINWKGPPTASGVAPTMMVVCAAAMTANERAVETVAANSIS